MKHSTQNRILSIFLAVLLAFGSVQFPVNSVETDESTQTDTSTNGQLQYDYDTLKITRNGAQLSRLELLSHEKIELSADGVSADADYQWQVEHPEQDDVWVNIYDGTEKTISVTLALMENVLRADGTARLRCRAYTEDYAYLTAPLTVQLLSQQETASVTDQPKTSNNSGVQTAAEETSDVAEYVTVEVHYVKYKLREDFDPTQCPEKQDLAVYAQGFMIEDGEAYGAYVATLLKGSAMAQITVTNPVLVGYDVVWDEQQTGARMEKDAVIIEACDSAEAKSFTVKYYPAQVNYTVHYYFQNIYDDKYVEDTTLQAPLTKQGYTGTRPDITVTHMAFDGFTSLYYEPDIIAADGSTVFHVYYERNYYLMEFDCNGGYGTDTVYVRYGTYISVPNPVKSGYVFAGWDLVETGEANPPALGTDQDGDGRMDGDGNEDLLPSTMPCYNSAYKALWTEANTTYSVAYWIDNGDGTKTYIGSQTIGAISGTTAIGTDDLTADTIICGKHSHDDTCYACGIVGHIHHTHTFDDCIKDLGFTYYTEVNNDADEQAIDDANNNDNTDSDPNAVYFYFIQTDNDKLLARVWPKILIGGTYYNVDGPASQNRLEEWVDGDLISEGKIDYNGTTYYAYKYKAKVTCGMEPCAGTDECALTEHNHETSNCVLSCGQEEHTHSDKCKALDRPYMSFVSGETKTVEGDGSTVVNVYYEYKTYTFKFYYGKEVNGQFFVPGGNTWGFAGDVNDMSKQLAAVSNWGAVAKPTLNTTLFRSDTYDEYSVSNETGKYYYISLSAKYGEDISQTWPANPFNPVETDGTFTHGNYAYFSAWNVDANTKYGKTYTNKTLKGNYQKLDDLLLIDGDTTELHYLAFWENGALGVGWNQPHKWIYNIYIPSADGTYQREDYGYVEEASQKSQGALDPLQYVLETGATFPSIDTKYSLYGQYTLYDDNENDYTNTGAFSPYCGQTPTALEGYKLAYHIVKDLGEYDSTYHLHTYQIDFYYEVNRHDLKFWNHNDWLGDGSGATTADGEQGIPYGMSLKPYSAVGNYLTYPAGLEPGAYEFAGWYDNNVVFNDDTKVDWYTLTMPDSDLTVYAYWKPVERDVYFYLTYDNMADHLEEIAKNPDNPPNPAGYTWATTDVNGNQVTYPITVSHGDLLGTAYSYHPERWEDTNGNGVWDEGEEKYTFVGWFYLDEDGKKRFAPDTMEVKDDLHLFAEWQSGIDTGYKVEYVLQSEATIDEMVYPAGTTLADPTEGHITAGRTKTFTAKAGTELLTEFQGASLFPTVNTHSLLMGADPNGNTYQFQYVVDETVWYKVRYLSKIDGTKLHEEYVTSTGNAIITEKFVPIEGYVPEHFYITKVLASDGDTGSKDSVIEENVITFYYIPNTGEALYNVEYYKKNLLTGEYEQVQSETVKDKVNEEITPLSIQQNKFIGYAFTNAERVTYKQAGVDENGKVTYTETVEELPKTDTELTGILTADGLVFKLYYDPITYPYRIEYQDTEGNRLGYVDPADNTFDESCTESRAPFGTVVTHEAPESITVNDKVYTLVSEETKSMDIRVEEDEKTSADCTSNVMVFVYTLKQIAIYYHAVCTVEGVVGGAVSQSHEFMTSNLIGSNALPYEGFRFEGWYSDEACTVTVSGGQHLNPKNLVIDETVDEVHYYALFAPITLTIKKDGTNINSGDSFLFSIVGQDSNNNHINLIVSVQGTGSVTINCIPTGKYVITELTDWSYQYTPDDAVKSVVVQESGTNTVTFTNTYKGSDWLGGENSKENVFVWNEGEDSN